MIVVAVIYAVNYFTLKGAYADGIDAFTALSIRAASGVLFFTIFHQLFIKEKVERKDIPKLALCALFGISLNQIFFMWGIERTSEVNAAILMVTAPVFVFLIAGIMRYEKFDWMKIAGLVLSFCGAALLINESAQGNFSFSNKTLSGDIMIMTNAMSYGLYLVIVRPLVLKYNTFTIVMWLFLFGSIINIPLGAAKFVDTDFGALTGKGVFGLVWLVFGTTLIAYFTNAWAMKRIPSSMVSMYIYMQPALVTIFAFFVYGDGSNENNASSSASVTKLLFMLIIFAGVYLVNRPRRKLPQDQGVAAAEKNS